MATRLVIASCDHRWSLDSLPGLEGARACALSSSPRTPISSRRSATRNFMKDAPTPVSGQALRCGRGECRVRRCAGRQREGAGGRNGRLHTVDWRGKGVASGCRTEGERCIRAEGQVAVGADLMDDEGGGDEDNLNAEELRAEIGQQIDPEVAAAADGIAPLFGDGVDFLDGLAMDAPRASSRR